MFDFKMNYQTNLQAYDESKENSVFFANFIKKSLGLPFNEKDPNYNTDKIIFSMSCNIEDVMVDMQKIQIMFILLNKKMKENNYGDPKINGNFLGKPVFDIGDERIGISSMMDHETQKNLDIIVRDNIFFKPYDCAPLFSNALSLIK